MGDLRPLAAEEGSSDDKYQPETVSESNLLLLWERKFCDVTFTFPNLPDRIQAHEFCLETRSPVFAKIFRTRQSENVRANEIEIPECTPEIFQQFLESDCFSSFWSEFWSFNISIYLPLVSKFGLKLAITAFSWGKNQAGTSSNEQFWRNKIKKNLISKIRYTNMTSEQFAKVVVPTGFLSAEEIVSVYTYLCADEVTRRGLKTKFNTIRRNVEHRETETKVVDFYADQMDSLGWFPPFSKHYITFKAERTEAYGNLLPTYLLKKPAITAIRFSWPYVNPFYDEHQINLDISIWECSGPAEEGNSIRRFQKTVLNCKPLEMDTVSVTPPVDVTDGGLYAISFESHSTLDLSDSFRNDPEAYGGLLIAANTKRETKIYLEDVSMTLKEIYRKTDFYAQEIPDRSGELATVRGMEIGLL